jgi:hypothetical protein
MYIFIFTLHEQRGSVTTHIGSFKRTEHEIKLIEIVFRFLCIVIVYLSLEKLFRKRQAKPSFYVEHFRSGLRVSVLKHVHCTDICA